MRNYKKSKCVFIANDFTLALGIMHISNLKWRVLGHTFHILLINQVLYHRVQRKIEMHEKTCLCIIHNHELPVT